jgi:signal transduction histidine kinase
MIRGRARRFAARATGPFAITWWTWLITLPFALTVMSGLQYVSGGPWAVLAVSGLQHLLVGALLVAAAALLRVVRGRWRPTVVLVLFVTIGALRPLLFLEAGGLIGISVIPGDLAGRIAINVVVVAVVFALIAAGVDLVRDHRGVFGRLRAAQRASERDLATAGSRLHDQRDAAVRDVLKALEDAAAQAAADRIAPAEAARLLRTLAEDVVRPASHRIYADPGRPVQADPDRPEGARAVWSASLIGGMAAAPAFVTAVLFSVLVAPFALLELDVALSIIAVGVGFVVQFAANVGIAHVRLPQRPGRRLTVLILLYTVAGLVVSLAEATVLTAAGASSGVVWFQALMYPIVAVAVALLTSLSERVRQDQAALEETVQTSVAAAARVRADVDHERAALARLLHSGVQAELIAGALALVADHDPDPDAAAKRMATIVDRVRGVLRGPQDEPGAPDQVRALIQSWSSAIPLSARIGEGVWERLHDPVRTTAVVDAISEGLANAVRHGDGSPVLLELRPDHPTGVEVVVVSGGTLDAAAPGIGLRQLSEWGQVALRETGGRVELAVAIP